MQEQTSIRVSKNLLNALGQFKEGSNDSYEDIIWDFLEPHLELSVQAKKDIETSKKEFKRGEFVSFEHIKEKFNLK